VAKPTKDIFDLKKFRAKMGAGKTILELPKNRQCVPARRRRRLGVLHSER
jgi:hypothetical protein